MSGRREEDLKQRSHKGRPLPFHLRKLVMQFIKIENIGGDVEMGENGEIMRDNDVEVSMEHSRVYTQRLWISGSGVQKKGSDLGVTCMKMITSPV